MNNISLIGMAGCGKSTVGSAISEKFNLSYIDTDHLIEKKSHSRNYLVFL